MRRATRVVHLLTEYNTISIHALLAESDCRAVSRRSRTGNFYPRSPCGERLFSVRSVVLHFRISIHALLAESDTPWGLNWCAGFLFLSTLSLRRATSTTGDLAQTVSDFYPRSPCGERLKLSALHAIVVVISIHALLAESDHARCPRPVIDKIFLSTLSLRRATLYGLCLPPVGKTFLSTLSLRRATPAT